MHVFRVIILNLVLSAIAIGIAYTAFLFDRIWSFRLPQGLVIAAWPLFSAGVFLILWALFVMIRFSGSSGAPGDPTKKLVRAGPYAWIRNPIYAGDALIILGLALFTRSPTMLIYAILFMLGIDIFVREYEEPLTERRLGEEYIHYKFEVPRWVPRIRKRKP